MDAFSLALVSSGLADSNILVSLQNILIWLSGQAGLELLAT